MMRSAAAPESFVASIPELFSSIAEAAFLDASSAMPRSGWRSAGFGTSTVICDRDDS